MTPPIEILLRRVVNDLVEAEVRFALVGGLAVSARIGPRTTQDVDFALATNSDDERDRVLGYFIRYGYRPMMDLHHTGQNRLATIRLVPPYDVGQDPDEGQPVADMICGACGIETEIVAAADKVTIAPDLTIPTARLPHLVAMKLLSESEKRLQDRLDLQALLAAATDADLAEVGPLLELIDRRGFSGGKDLHATLARFQSEG